MGINGSLTTHHYGTTPVTPAFTADADMKTQGRQLLITHTPLLSLHDWHLVTTVFFLVTDINILTYLLTYIHKQSQLTLVIHETLK